MYSQSKSRRKWPGEAKIAMRIQGWISEKIPSKLPGCVNVILYYGSSACDTAQMSRLIDLIVQECRQQDIETLTPAELAAMMEGWDAKTNKGAGDPGRGQAAGV